MAAVAPTVALLRKRGLLSLRGCLDVVPEPAPGDKLWGGRAMACVYRAARQAAGPHLAAYVAFLFQRSPGAVGPKCSVVVLEVCANYARGGALYYAVCSSAPDGPGGAMEDVEAVRGLPLPLPPPLPENNDVAKAAFVSYVRALT